MTSYISDLLIKLDALTFIVKIIKRCFNSDKNKVCGGVSVNINQLVLQDNNSKIKM